MFVGFDDEFIKGYFGVFVIGIRYCLDYYVWYLVVSGYLFYGCFFYFRGEGVIKVGFNLLNYCFRGYKLVVCYD